MALIAFGPHSPVVAENVFIAPTATLIGEVTVSPEVTIMFGAVVRADRDSITIGVGSNIQDTVVIHGDPGFPTRIGARVSVGHGAIVHGAQVEDDCLIGMGATLLNGVHLGRGSLVAAGSVILEGTIIPPGSLVAGVPGKIRRTLSPEESDAITANAETYRRLGARYREETSS
jgi:carbonic anhydrase/acetyltransferase-like protein (isoleucine patch superfamily)